jgi:TatD family-associated radical SAM protein
MDEIKNNQGGQQGQGHGRKRRRHRHGRGGGQGGQTAQVQQVQQPQKQAQQAQPKQAQPQPQRQKQQKQQGKGEKPQPKTENRKDTYVYILDGNLYINLTNKCSNACDFCVRNERASYYGNYLWLTKGDPTADKVIAALNGLGDLKRFKEAVFCGFGEPTYRVEEMVAVCDYLHGKGVSTRLNTNGQGNLVNKRDIVPELVGKLDLINVSLNASCYEKYQKVCRSQFKEAGFDGMIEFAKSCKRHGINVRFSIVDCIGEEEVEACKKLAQSVNIPLYIRDYITDS